MTACTRCAQPIRDGEITTANFHEHINCPAPEEPVQEPNRDRAVGQLLALAEVTL